MRRDRGLRAKNGYKDGGLRGEMRSRYREESTQEAAGTGGCIRE